MYLLTVIFACSIVGPRQRAIDGYANTRQTFSLDFNGGHVEESRMAKVKPIRISHSESRMSDYNCADLYSSPQDSYQTFPKRSPVPKRRGKLSDLMESPSGLRMNNAPDQQSVQSLPLPSTPEQERSPRDKTSSSLDSTKRSSSSQSLPQIQDDLGRLSPESKVFKVSGLVKNPSNSRKVSPELDNVPLVNEALLQNPNLPSDRKSNLKKRSFFTFMKKKK